MEKVGYIYVLTNESFHMENWVKIGYTENVEKRVKELSNTSVPFPFEVYCTYEIPSIKGVKDPDKLVHDIIKTLNPTLRIKQNREFFSLYPWDAYDLLYAIALMHGRTDKLVRNYKNTTDQEVQNEAENSLDSLYSKNSEERKLFEKLRSIILAQDPTLEESISRVYVSFKKGKRNTMCLWPKSGWIEVVLNAKIGQIDDKHEMIYDISNRRWSSEQYAFKFYDDTDIEAVKDILSQTLALKK